MTSREQLETEIAQLKAEIHRRISSASGTFPEIESLRAQADGLERVLALQIQEEHHSALASFMLLGFVRNQDDVPTAFCALTWSGPASQPSGIRILLKQEWRSLLPPAIIPYLVDLSHDWRQLIQTNPATLVSTLRELSVGPLRTMEEATTRRDMITQLVHDRLGAVEVFSEPASPTDT